MFVEQAIKLCYRHVTPNGFLYQLPSDFPAFKGHFEGHPLLPAICHISFCADAASRLLHKQIEVRAIKRAKFINPVLPGMELEVKLTIRTDGWYLAELTDTAHQKKLSQAVLQFAERV